MLPLIFVFEILSGFAFIVLPFSIISAVSTSSEVTYPSGAFVSFIVYLPYSTFLNCTFPFSSLIAVAIGFV